jgi:hypothetical protein
MNRVRLIHWKAEESAERAERIRPAGYEVDYEPLAPDILRKMREDPPDAVVIDLGRLPSQGRDIALAIRKYKATRHVPLVFVEGDPKKVAKVQELLPDAVYTTWDEIGVALEQAITHPPVEPVVPESTMAAYAGRPLPKKLGIKEGSVVSLIGAPEGFEATLGELPLGVTLDWQGNEPSDLTIWFTRSRAGLEQGMEAMVPRAARAPLWIAWPKKASGVVSDLTQQIVRETGLDAGLVDYKVCSIDATWSGLLFTKRKQREVEDEH